MKRTRLGYNDFVFRCIRLEGLPCDAYTLNVSIPETGMLESFHSVCIENAVILGRYQIKSFHVVNVTLNVILMRLFMRINN